MKSHEARTPLKEPANDPFKKTTNFDGGTPLVVTPDTVYVPGLGTI